MAIYLEYEGIKGNVTAEGYKDHIAVLSGGHLKQIRATEWPGGPIKQNILPPTLNTVTPSHCTLRVAAGSLRQ